MQWKLQARALLARLAPLALTILSTQLFGLAYPPHRIRILAWVALAPFFLALRGTGLAHALFLGWVWSVLAAYSVGQWMPGAIESYYLQTKLVGWLFFLGIATVMVAPYHTAFALCGRSLWTRWQAALPLLLAAAWTAAELGRGRLLTETPFFIGNPWALLGYSQMGWLPVTQIADLAGVYGITFVVAASNAAIAVAGVAIFTRGSRRVLAACLATGLLPAALTLAYGTTRLAGAEAVEASSEPVPVAIVQGDVSFGSRWRADYYGRDLEAYLRLTLDVLRQGKPRIVFWPESSMTFFLEREPSYQRSIASVFAPFGAELVAGAPRAGSEEARPTSTASTSFRARVSCAGATTSSTSSRSASTFPSAPSSCCAGASGPRASTRRGRASRPSTPPRARPRSSPATKPCCPRSPRSASPRARATW